MPPIHRPLRALDAKIHPITLNCRQRRSRGMDRPANRGICGADFGIYVSLDSREHQEVDWVEGSRQMLTRIISAPTVAPSAERRGERRASTMPNGRTTLVARPFHLELGCVTESPPIASTAILR